MATNQMRREAAKRKLANQQERRAKQSKRRKQIAMITSAAVVVVVVVGVVLLSTLRGSGSDSTSTAADGAAARPASVNCSYPSEGTATKPAQAPPTADVGTQGTVGVTLQTNSGAIPLTLDRSLAPCTVNSFVSLARQGYFDATNCHRLTTSAGLQVLQCGDPSGAGSGGPGYTFADETAPGLKYGRGTLAMANAGPNTNGSQFFIVYGDAQLPPNYTVFGSISPEGLQVVDGIAHSGTDSSNGPGDGKPVQPVTIQTATVG